MYDPMAAASGVRPTLREFKKLADNAAGLSPKQQRLLDAWGSKKQRAIRSQQLDKYRASAERGKERHSDGKAALDAINAECADLIAGLSSGRISAAVGRRQAAEVHKALRVVREWASESRAEESAAWETACADPADFEDQQLQEFPLLRQSLPALTQGYLDGDPSHDPFSE